VDSDDESTLDLLEAKVPALLEAGLEERSKDSTNKNPQKSGDHPAKRTQIPQLQTPQLQTPQLLTLEATPTPGPENTPDDTLEPESTNQQTSKFSKATDALTETQELQNTLPVELQSPLADQEPWPD
jgi:hypothetical protein